MFVFYEIKSPIVDIEYPQGICSPAFVVEEWVVLNRAPTHSHPLTHTPIHSHQFPPTPVYSHPLTSNPTHSHPFRSTPIHCHPLFLQLTEQILTI